VIEIDPVTPERWPDVAELFTRKGPRGGTPMTAGCWCKGVWAIVCFYVDPRAKERGVATALLDAAVAHAFRRGAASVEAYPHVDGDYMGRPEPLRASGLPARAERRKAYGDATRARSPGLAVAQTARAVPSPMAAADVHAHVTLGAH
jgi:hypothetical protein